MPEYVPAALLVFALFAPVLSLCVKLYIPDSCAQMEANMLFVSSDCLIMSPTLEVPATFEMLSMTRVTSMLPETGWYMYLNVSLAPPVTRFVAPSARIVRTPLPSVCDPAIPVPMSDAPHTLELKEVPPNVSLCTH